jgi:tripartite-type tricarboxylate transporter receptor subunit TctC
MNEFRRAMTLSLAALGILSVARPARAAFPDKVINFLAPFSTGGPSDALTRALANGLQQTFPQPVVVQNMPGAGGSLMVDRLAHSPADGYTIGLITNATQAINPVIMSGSINYDPGKDFTFLSGVSRYSNFLVVPASTPYKSLDDLLRFAKSNGKGINFGSAGIGSSNHISGEMLRVATGAPMTHIPYKGNAAPMQDLIGGRLDYMFDILVSCGPMIKDGRLRALAMTGNKRSIYAPDVPTLAELGFPAATGEFWFAVAGPANLPSDVAARLNTELTQLLRSSEMTSRLAQYSFDPWPTSIEELTRTVHEEIAKWGDLVKKLGIER